MKSFVFLRHFEGFCGDPELGRRAKIFLQNLKLSGHSNITVFLMSPESVATLVQTSQWQDELGSEIFTFFGIHWSTTYTMPSDVQLGHYVLDIIKNNSCEKCYVDNSIVLPKVVGFQGQEVLVSLQLASNYERVWRHLQKPYDMADVRESLVAISSVDMPKKRWSDFEYQTKNADTSIPTLVVDTETNAAIRLLNQFFAEDPGPKNDYWSVGANLKVTNGGVGHWSSLQHFSAFLNEASHTLHFIFIGTCYNMESYAYMAHSQGHKVTFVRMNDRSGGNKYANCNGLRGLLNKDVKAPKMIRICATEESPLLSICLTHKDRPHFLEQALQSLAAQTSKNFELILVDDGSSSQKSTQYFAELKGRVWPFSITVIETSNQFLGAARNCAVSSARGEFLLFMDDDNIAFPTEVAAILSHQGILRAGAVLTIPCLVFEGDSVPSFTENLLSWKYGIDNLHILKLLNVAGDANFAISSSTFNKLGGFTTDYGVGHEDWEFFVKARSSNVRIETLQHAEFFYRKSTTGMLSESHKQEFLRHLRPLIEKYLEAGNFLEAINEIAWVRSNM